MSSEGKTSVVQAQVTVPSVETVKDQLTPDLSGIPLVSTIAQGNVPSNKELNDAIDRTKEGLQSTKDEANLNLHGERLVKDASDILESAQNFINEKNRGEKIQSLIKHTKEASDATSKQASSAYSRISSLLTSTLGFNFPSSEIKSDAQDAYDYGRELMLFAIRSKEFRSLLLDLINFFESAVDNASSQLLQIGDSLKADVKNNNTNLTATSNQVDKTKAEVQDSIENKQAEWSAETKRAYYKRFQSLLNRISEKPEYKRLLDLYWKWMDDLKVRANELSETLKVKADQASNIAANAATKVANDSAFEKIWADVRAIVDEFAGQGEFDAFYNEMWNLYVEIVNDPAANAYFDSLRKFVVDAVNDPATLNNEAKQREGEELLYRGRRLMESPKFTARYNKTLRIINNFFDKISNDAVTNDFAAKLKRFGEDLVLDSQGRPDLYVMQDSLAQVKNLVVPLLSKQLGSLSIAKLAGSNDSYDWSIEHLAVAIPNIIPEHFQLRTKNIIDINVKELETEKNNTKVVMELRNLRPVFKDLKFWYQRKTFPRIEDFGTCDVDLSKGQGAKIKVIWKIKSKSNRPFAFSLMEVKCVIDSLDVTVKDAKHEYLDRLATTLFAASFKQSLAAGIVNALVDSVQPLNDQMNAWFATRPVQSIYDRANEQVHSAFVQTNATIKDRPVERIVEKVKDTYNTLAEKANESIESAKEVISEQASNVSSYVSEKSGDLKEAAVQAKDAVVEKAEEIKKEAEKLSDEAHTHVWQKVSKKTKPKKKHGPGVVNDKDFPTLADGNKFDVLTTDSPASNVNAI